MFDLIAIGDSVIDTYIPLNVGEVSLNKDGDSIMLCFRLGEKIPVGATFSTAAGNALNCTIGAAKLGLKSAIYSHVGRDLSGEKIKAVLKKEGINISYLVEDNLVTNNNIVLAYKGERTILVHHQPYQYQLPDLDKTRWLYLTSMAENYLKTAVSGQLVNYLERNNARLFFNPGTYQIKIGLKKIPRLLSLTEVIVVNLDEARIILEIGEEKKVAIKKVLQSMVDLGPRMVIVTDGKNGSYGFDGNNFYHLGVIPVEVVDMTGAGDSFAAGVLAGFFYGKEMAETMRWGAVNAAANIKKVGAVDGLLNYEELLAKLKENPKIVANKI